MLTNIDNKLVKGIKSKRAIAALGTFLLLNPMVHAQVVQDLAPQNTELVKFLKPKMKDEDRVQEMLDKIAQTTKDYGQSLKELENKIEEYKRTEKEIPPLTIKFGGNIGIPKGRIVSKYNITLDDIAISSGNTNAQVVISIIYNKTSQKLLQIKQSVADGPKEYELPVTKEKIKIKINEIISDPTPEARGAKIAVDTQELWLQREKEDEKKFAKMRKSLRKKYEKKVKGIIDRYTGTDVENFVLKSFLASGAATIVGRSESHERTRGAALGGIAAFTLYDCIADKLTQQKVFEQLKKDGLIK